ncbi:MAG: O-antigen ligase family protein [Candidatus Aminicenantes bacterium]|nr:O-antigen ligase family protein [Candidatus Aminicenantes bacterium]
MSEKVIFWGLCAVLVLLPLPYGGVYEWTIFIFEAGTLVLFGLYWAGKLAARNECAAEGVGRIPLAVKVLAGVFFAVSLAQILPLPQEVLAFISPRAHRFYQDVSAGWLGEITGRTWKTISFAPNLSLYEIIKYACYGIFGFLVYKVIRTKNKAKSFVFVIILSGIFQAVYGLTELWGGTSRIFGWTNKWNQGSAFGTFVNRDHFSAFLEMIFPLSLGYLLAGADFFAMKKGLSFREKILWFGQERLQKSIIVGTAASILGVALLFSRCRAGVIIFFVSIFIMLMILSMAEGGRKTEDWGGTGAGPGRSRSKRAVRTVSLAVILTAVLIGIQPILARFTKDTLTLKAGRPVYYLNTVEMVGAYPLAGVGLGAYMYVYPMFEKASDPGLLSHAHNDYLEVLAESGVVGGAALIAGAIATLMLIGAGWAKRHDPLLRGIGLGCLVGIAAILIHSFGDFSLRIPANATYLVTLYALGLGAVGLRSRQGAGLGNINSKNISLNKSGLKRDDGITRILGSNSGGRGKAALAKMKASLMLAGTVGLLFLAVKHNLGFLYLNKYEAARKGAAEGGQSLMSGFPEFERQLQKAVRYSNNPIFYREAGLLYLGMAAAENMETGKEERDARRDALLDRAREAFVEQIKANPADAQGYYYLGKVYLLYNYPLLTYGDKGRMFLRKTLNLKPHDLFFNQSVIFDFLAMWDGLSEEEKAWIMKWLKTVWVTNAEAFYPELKKRWEKDIKSLDALKVILRSDAAVWSTASRYF